VGQRHAVCLSVMIAVLMALASKATAALESCWRWNGTKDFGLLAAARVEL